MPPARHLLDTLIGFYEISGRAGDSGAAATLDRALPSLRRAAAVTLSPRALPVSELLIPALAAIDPPLARTALGQAALVGALRGAAALYRWRQNPNYTAANMGAAFMAGYGYIEIAGPRDALFHAPDVRAGLLVLGPGIHYPVHAHPAEEVYHPLTAGAWRRGDEGWRAIPPGQAVHHAPMVPHETRAESHTLLALYCWIGDTTTEARLA